MSPSAARARAAAARSGRLVLAAATILAAIGPAAAEHHREKRALMEARCIPASMREASRAGDHVAYEVVCDDAASRRITLVCGPSRCLVDRHGDHVDDDAP